MTELQLKEQKDSFCTKDKHLYVHAQVPEKFTKKPSSSKEFSAGFVA